MPHTLPGSGCVARANVHCLSVNSFRYFDWMRLLVRALLYTSWNDLVFLPETKTTKHAKVMCARPRKGLALPRASHPVRLTSSALLACGSISRRLRSSLAAAPHVVCVPRLRQRLTSPAFLACGSASSFHACCCYPKTRSFCAPA